MFEVIKGSNPFNSIVIDGDAVISNKIPGLDPEVSEEEEDGGKGVSEGKDGKKDDDAPTISMEQLEALREEYRKEGRDYAVAMHRKADQELTAAKDEAKRIAEEAEEKSRQILAETDVKARDVLEEARLKGMNEGYEEGAKKGEEDGYIQGLKKCKETLLDLKKICEDFENEKAELIAENRRGIFDLALGIAEKVTAVTFAQKDKKALEKMITAAAKEFRNVKNIRVTLSKLDLSEDMETDFKAFEKCFSPTTNVEFEAIDAESGTLMLESDTEILDAGVSTQLKMIGELGRGRFREKEPTPESEDTQIEPKESKPAKPRKSTKSSKSKKAAEAVSDTPEVQTAVEAPAEAASPIAVETPAVSTEETLPAGVTEIPTLSSAPNVENIQEIQETQSVQQVMEEENVQTTLIDEPLELS